MDFVRTTLELLIFWLISVYFLYQVSRHLKLSRQDIRTAVAAGAAGILLGVLIFSLFSGTGVRFIALVSYLILIRVFYGCAWGHCCDVLTRTVFFSLLFSLPLILIIEYLKV
jgi:hypothetical protein